MTAAIHIRFPVVGEYKCKVCWVSKKKNECGLTNNFGRFQWSCLSLELALIIYS